MAQTETFIDYRIVLDDLKRRRTHIDGAINAIESLLNDRESQLPEPTNSGQSKPAPSGSLLNLSPSTERGAQIAVVSNRFARTSIVEAARILMRERGQPLSAQAIAIALTEQGYVAKSRNLTNTVASVLNRHDKTGGDVIRVGRNMFSLVPAKLQAEQLT